MSTEHELHFIHHLRDTLLLLGAPVPVVELTSKLSDGMQESDVDKLRNYNISLIEATKTRLMRLNTIKIVPTDDGKEKE